MSIELPDELVLSAVRQANEAIDENATPRLIMLIVMGTFIAGGVKYAPEDADLDVLNDAAMAGAQWSYDNGRNGFGYACAIARYVRDAGGVWTAPEVLHG